MTYTHIYRYIMVRVRGTTPGWESETSCVAVRLKILELQVSGRGSGTEKTGHLNSGLRITIF